MELGAFHVTPGPCGVAGLPKACAGKPYNEGDGVPARADQSRDPDDTRRFGTKLATAIPAPEGLAFRLVLLPPCIRHKADTARLARPITKLATDWPTRRAGQRSRFLRLPLAPPHRRCPRFTADTESHCISTASIRAGGGPPSRSCGGHGIACGMELKL